jgi:hypothetical protein
MGKFVPKAEHLRETQDKRDKEAALLDTIGSLGLEYDHLLAARDWAGIRRLAARYRKLGKGAAFGIARKLEKMAADHGV